MIPKILHFTVPKEVTPSQQKAIDRAKELHPDWEIKVWKDPVDTTSFRLASYHAKANSGAQLADLIRLDIIYLYGGVYLDSDVVLRRDLTPLLGSDHFFCSEDGTNLTNAVFSATAKNPIVLALIDDLLANEPDWSDPPNISTGPKFFSRKLKWHEGLNLLPRETFYPYNWNEEPVDPPATCYGVHEWAGSWKTNKVARRTPPQTSKSFIKNGIKNLLSPVIEKISDRVAMKIALEEGPRPRVYPMGGDLIIKTSRQLFMSVSGSDLSITPELALNGSYEEAELKFLDRELRGGDFFVDVGCNVGVFSLVAARRVGTFGRVHAYDANPAALKHLDRSLVMNWMHERCTVKHRAIGAQASKVSLQFSEGRLGDGNIGLGAESTFQKSVQRLGDLREVDVDMVRLDDEFRFDQEIKILKIDVEGFEHGVIKGAERLIANRCIKYILMELLEEVAGRQHNINIEAVNWVIKQGYRLGKIERDGSFLAAPHNRADRKSERNIVLMRS